MVARDLWYLNSDYDFVEFDNDDLEQMQKDAINILSYNYPALLWRDTTNPSFSLPQTHVPVVWSSSTLTPNPVPGSLQVKEYNQAWFRQGFFPPAESDYLPLLADPTANFFPIWRKDSNSFQAMTANEFIDTICKPAIDKHVRQVSGYEGFHYICSKSNSVDGYTYQGKVYQDYVNNYPSSYSSTKYYIYRKNIDDTLDDYVSSYKLPIFLNQNWDVYEMSRSNFDGLLEKMIRYTATQVAGYEISYAIKQSDTPNDTTETRMGTIIEDYVKPTADAKSSISGNFVNDKGTVTGDKHGYDDTYQRVRYPSSTATRKRWWSFTLQRT